MKIVIVDDDKLVCSSLKIMLEAGGQIAVAAIGHDGPTAILLYEQHRPDVMLMDIRMGATLGLDAAEEILHRSPEAKILFLTTFSDNEYIIRALKIGGKGYLLKEDFESIAPAIMAVNAGQHVFGRPVMEKLPDLMGQKKKAPAPIPLSDKEEQVLAQVAEGKNNKEIAAELYLSEGTVRNYISLLLEKLELRNRTELAIYYYRSR
jgi:DNA-binding NarL/FixJ family response regulator